MFVEQLPQSRTADCQIQVFAAYAPEAERAIAILADALRRQGSHPQPGDTASGLTLSTARNAFNSVLLVLDEELLHRPAVRSQLKSGALLVVGTERTPREIAWYLPEFMGTIATIDAETVAAEAGADLCVGLLGAAARVSNLIDADVLCAAVHHRYDSAHPYLAGAAMRACDNGYQQAQF